MRFLTFQPRLFQMCALASVFLCLAPGSQNAFGANTDDDPPVETRRVILDPRVVSDDFGKRIAKSHLAMQVTVANNNKEMDLIILHAAFDLTKALSQQRIATFQQNVKEVNDRLSLQGGARYSSKNTAKTSSVDLALLQGVAQKGQNFDARNQLYRAILAIGTVGAGLVGVAGLGPVLPRAVAAWTGPVITSFNSLFPDLTVDEVIRLNDRAYTANTLVPREKSKVFVVFLPLDLIMTDSEKKEYWKHPSEFLSLANATGTALDFSQIEVEVTYKFIMALNDVPPMITDVVFAANELDNFTKKAPVHGSLVGRFLDGGTVSLLEGATLGLDVAADPKQPSSDTRLNFIITPKNVVPASTRVTFQVTRDKLVTPFSKVLSHQVPPVTLTTIDPAAGAPKMDIVVKLTGSGFQDGDVSVLIDGSDSGANGVKTSNLKVKDSSNIEVTFSIDEKAKPGDREVQLKSSGGLSGTKKFTVQAPAPAPKP
jgi:hypothetical protein